MPTEVAEAVAQRTKAVAMQVERQLRELAADFGPKYWRIGLLIAEVAIKQLWNVRGFESERKYQEFIRIPHSTWYMWRRRTIDLAIPLMKKKLLTRKALDRLTGENADQLLRLDERRRYAATWIHKALTMSEPEFAAQVDHVLDNGTEPEEGLGAPESNSTLKISMKASQKSFILESMKEFTIKWNENSEHADSQLKLDDQAGILENLIADARAGW